MVVEHAFVTTLDAPEAMRTAAEFLAARGFTSTVTGAFPVGDPSWTSLRMTRGKSTRTARSVADLPQTVRLDFDRGRVTVAVSITPSAAWGGGAFYSEPAATSKRMHLHRQLLTAIASSLELLLGQRQQPGVAAGDWDAAEAAIALAARRRKRRNLIILAVVALFFGGLITLAISAG